MRMPLLLAGAIAAAAALGFIGSRTNASGTDLGSASNSSPPESAANAAAEPVAQNEDAENTLRGEVLETLAVSKYTYLRLRTDNGEAWAAVPTAVVALHTQVAIADATRMDDFKSSTLKRTFKTIYFGTLAQAAAANRAPRVPLVPSLDDDDQDLPPGHPSIGATNAPAIADENLDNLPPGHPAVGGATAPGPVTGSEALPPGHPDIGKSVHGSGSGLGEPDNAAEQPATPSAPVTPARGPGAHRIAELAGQHEQLAGEHVRVRAEVTKVVEVQGHAFFHLSDGSADRSGAALDLVATSSTAPSRGQIATFDGTLRTSVDVGIGFKYPLLLENATISGE